MSLDITKELSQNFIEYAYAVNSDRSIPDAKSGLKPVARRILFGAFNSGKTSNKPYVKNAHIVGEVMAKLHPHGDSSIYGALVRLSQSWVMRYPLIDFHGNQGSINGDGAAAMRYTEGRLTKLAEEGLLDGLKKRNVPFAPTYDDSMEEPITLPAIFPNLLCNPNSGIGVAMASSFACHNLCEVKDAIFAYMNGEEPMLPGPDFPTGGIVINGKDIPNIMKTGHGSVKIRSKYEVHKNTIKITEIPYGQTIEGLIENISTYCDENPGSGVKEIRDQTSNKGVEIDIDIDSTANPDYVMKMLFAKTNLQSSFSYNQIALVDKTPTELNLKDCIKIYVDHNLECLINETNFDLDKANARLEIVNGLLKALEDIDEIIKLIKASESSSAAKDKLIITYSFTENQAKAIINMTLGKLAGLERIEIQKEKAELDKKIEELNTLLSNKDLQLEEIKRRLQKIVDKYGDKRRTVITNIEEPKDKREKEIECVIPEECVVVITNSNTIKRVPSKSYRVQKRNGIGIKNSKDLTAHTFRTNTIDALMVFTSKGKMYRIIVDNIPAGTNASSGTPITTLINMEPDEYPMAYTSLHHNSTAKYVFFATKKGIIKKVPLTEYNKTKRNSGIISIALREGDSLAAVTFIEEEEMLLATEKGMMIRFETKNMPISSRTAQGVKGISLKEEDTVLTCLPIKHNTDYLAVVSKDGFGKKIELKEFNIQNRGGKGVIYSKESISGIALVEDSDNLLITGDKTSICINASELPLLSKTSIGNSVIKNNRVVSISKI